MTIGVPTYNRRGKLERLLRHLSEQCSEAVLAGRVRVLVSDNASEDGTAEFLARFSREPRDFEFRHHRQERNVGVVRNMAWLYDHCESDYLWFFADDDVPLEGAVRKVHDALLQSAPPILLFSFIQPPGSEHRTFDFPETVHLVDEPAAAARLIARGAKLSNFVCRREELSSESAEFLRDTVERGLGGYYHCLIGVSAMAARPGPRLAVVSEPLATCDDDFRILRTPASDWAQLGRIFEHPYLRREAPQLTTEFTPKDDYLGQAAVFWAWRCGALEVDPSFVDEYERAVSEFTVRWGWLFRDPRMLVRVLVIKFLPAAVPRALHRLAGAVKPSSGSVSA